MLLLNSKVSAERIQNETAVFSALDKVTASIKKLEIPINQTIEFGSLKVKPFICYSNPPTEAPKTTSFVEIEEVQLDGEVKKIFSGWMLAESPSLNAVEHPVFDIWLIGCANPKKSWSPTEPSTQEFENKDQKPNPDDATQPARRKRVRG